MYGLVRCLAECMCFSVMCANIIGQVMPDFLDYGLLPRGIFGRRRGPFQSFTVKRGRRRTVSASYTDRHPACVWIMGNVGGSPPDYWCMHWTGKWKFLGVAHKSLRLMLSSTAVAVATIPRAGLCSSWVSGDCEVFWRLYD